MISENQEDINLPWLIHQEAGVIPATTEVVLQFLEQRANQALEENNLSGLLSVNFDFWVVARRNEWHIRHFNPFIRARVIERISQLQRGNGEEDSNPHQYCHAFCFCEGKI